MNPGLPEKNWLATRLSFGSVGATTRFHWRFGLIFKQLSNLAAMSPFFSNCNTSL